MLPTSIHMSVAHAPARSPRPVIYAAAESSPVWQIILVQLWCLLLVHVLEAEALRSQSGEPTAARSCVHQRLAQRLAQRSSRRPVLEERLQRLYTQTAIPRELTDEFLATTIGHESKTLGLLCVDAGRKGSDREGLQ
jgi:hypothetical protein